MVSLSLPSPFFSLLFLDLGGRKIGEVGKGGEGWREGFREGGEFEDRGGRGGEGGVVVVVIVVPKLKNK